MIAFPTTPYDLASTVGWLAAGTVIGAVHFLSLRWNVRKLATGRSFFPVMAVQIGRFAAMAVLLAAIVRTSGALPLLAVASGILVARTVFVRMEA